ncbi:MAG: hypothetical protein ACXWC4_17395 [Telluria sp.]
MKGLWLAAAALWSAGIAADVAAEQQVKMNVLSDTGIGAPVGTVTVTETQMVCGVIE